VEASWSLRRNFASREASSSDILVVPCVLFNLRQGVIQNLHKPLRGSRPGRSWKEGRILKLLDVWNSAGSVDHIVNSLGVKWHGASVDWLTWGEARVRTIGSVAIGVDKRVSAADDVAVVASGASLNWVCSKSIASLRTLGRVETMSRFRLAKMVNSLETLDKLTVLNRLAVVDRLTVLDRLTMLSSRCGCINERDTIGANSDNLSLLLLQNIRDRRQLVWCLQLNSRGGLGGSVLKLVRRRLERSSREAERDLLISILILGLLSSSAGKHC
jgi:hypothetical protein